MYLPLYSPSRGGQKKIVGATGGSPILFPGFPVRSGMTSRNKQVIPEKRSVFSPSVYFMSPAGGGAGGGHSFVPPPLFPLQRGTEENRRGDRRVAHFIPWIPGQVGNDESVGRPIQPEPAFRSFRQAPPPALFVQHELDISGGNPYSSAHSLETSGRPMESAETIK